MNGIFIEKSSGINALSGLPITWEIPRTDYFVESSADGLPIFHHDTFTFKAVARGSGTIIWYIECTQRASKQPCPVTGVRKKNGSLYMLRRHNHSPRAFCNTRRKEQCKPVLRKTTPVLPKPQSDTHKKNLKLNTEDQSLNNFPKSQIVTRKRAIPVNDELNLLSVLKRPMAKDEPLLVNSSKCNFEIEPSSQLCDLEFRRWQASLKLKIEEKRNEIKSEISHKVGLTTQQSSSPVLQIYVTDLHNTPPGKDNESPTYPVNCIEDPLCLLKEEATSPLSVMHSKHRCDMSVPASIRRRWSLLTSSLNPSKGFA